MSELQQIIAEGVERARRREERLRNANRLKAWRERYRQHARRQSCQTTTTTA